MTQAKISSVAMFAEDSREEVQGSISLIGILPDNVNMEMVDGQTAVLPKLVIYVRSVIDLRQGDLETLQVSLITPSGQISFQSTTEAGTMADHAAGSKSTDQPILTFITQIVAAPFPLLEHGQFRAVVKYGDYEQLAGILNVEATTSNADPV